MQRQGHVLLSTIHPSVAGWSLGTCLALTPLREEHQVCPPVRALSKVPRRTLRSKCPFRHLQWSRLNINVPRRSRSRWHSMSCVYYRMADMSRLMSGTVACSFACVQACFGHGNIESNLPSSQSTSRNTLGEHIPFGLYKPVRAEPILPYPVDGKAAHSTSRFQGCRRSQTLRASSSAFAVCTSLVLSSRVTLT